MKENEIVVAVFSLSLMDGLHNNHFLNIFPNILLLHPSWNRQILKEKVKDDLPLYPR